MKSNILIIFLLFLFTACSENRIAAQSGRNGDKKVGGSCEGCEAIYESTKRFPELSHTDTLEDYIPGKELLELSGRVYKIDGKTPAPGVVLYIYHTDHTGVYPVRGNEKDWGRRHGYLRGWIKTNANGEYKFFTAKPGAYPGRRDPAHIHCIVKEPSLNEYYIGDFLFDDDPLVTAEEKNSTNRPGGNGVVKLRRSGDRMIMERNIILGKNVLNYPTSVIPGRESGLAIGADCPAFDPVHVTGPDENSTACPMCKYGRGQGLMIWWNKASLDELQPMLATLENEIVRKGFKKLRVFVMYMNTERKSLEEVNNYTRSFANENNLKKIAITYIPSPDDPQTAGLYNINENVSNTILAYKARRVVAKYIDYDPSLQIEPLLSKLQ